MYGLTQSEVSGAKVAREMRYSLASQTIHSSPTIYIKVEVVEVEVGEGMNVCGVQHLLLLITLATCHLYFLPFHVRFQKCSPPSSQERTESHAQDLNTFLFIRCRYHGIVYLYSVCIPRKCIYREFLKVIMKNLLCDNKY